MSKILKLNGSKPKSTGLGSCCGCGSKENKIARVACLPYKTTEPGTGWGCKLCNLALDGAIAPMCEACMAKGTLPKFFCVGWPGDDVRKPVAELPNEKHEHSAFLHQVVRKPL
jgi:hypothetical protein